ncbi:hypothetical protein PSI23_10810 [Xenorhabdus sp. XENO-10]|uniref:Uncharacterized protein n=1 Tax=Xenorhabdus yunnanensis TaxID=3025878 RepID=A0ABT5LGR7_9GAMM|nr:hypothetical protein [Xenorhabdus yunnanensis]MDC9589773.1 hypothetical protein [Xenorhabdus yunnanensis]
MTTKNFGFKNLSTIKPDDTPSSDIADHEIDVVGDRSGFVSREAVQKVVRRAVTEPSANLNIRPPVSTYNRFVLWAMENRMSYPEALKALMDKAGI